jgi:hypothetical protein
MNEPLVREAGRRRAQILEFLRGRTVPASIQDFVSLLKEPAPLIRGDLRHLERLGTVKQRRHKGSSEGLGRAHAVRYCTWELA